MKKCCFIAIAFSVTLLSSCAREKTIVAEKWSATDSTVTQRQQLIGKWHGEATNKEGGRRTWKMNRHADGTYEIEIRFIETAGTFVQSEFGIWGVSGGVYFTATRGYIDSGKQIAVDTSDPVLYSTYKITKLTADDFLYTSLSNGNEYHVTREKP
jgi:hypothetical protein